jgi:hypothetical protein
MTRKEALLLVSRGSAVYLLCWAIGTITYLPERLLSFTHHASSSGLLTENYLRNYDLISIALLFVRVVALFALANWFYNCGPKVEDFFFAPEQAANADQKTFQHRSGKHCGKAEQYSCK